MKFKTLKGQDQQETSSTPICCCCPVAPLCSTLYNPRDCSTPGFPVLHLQEFAQTHVHWVSDAIQPSHSLSSPSPPAFYLSQRPPTQLIIASLWAQMVKNQPAIWETWVGKMPCRKAWKPTPVFLPGESPWTKEAGGLQSMGSQSGTRLSH